MVFESLVTDVLNRFLGDYIENLDSKQLKIGIWGGDVVLNNLILKQSALNDLDLPVQTVFGRLDKLVLKIPWKNLYGSAVEASIEGLYLIVKPNSEVTYNAEREEKRLQDAKIAELQKIEDAKKREKEEKKPDDTLVEKLVTQIIKNVQLSIKNIHIRYEESNCPKPYSMGITLGSLTLHTTDEDWKPTIVQESVKKIFKVVNLDSLSVYWNCDSQLYSHNPKDSLRTILLGDIAMQNSIPSNYKYILGPINSEQRLILNPKPEHDSPQFVFPKAHAEVVIEDLKIAITKSQYKDVINFADSMSLQNKGVPYRKFRPKVSSYKGHYKEWWHFAYKCILETDVKRRQLNWDWNHMSNHRIMCKEYGEAYKNKLQTKKVNKLLEEQICSMEKRIDLFNIVIIRERIEMEVIRLDKKIEESKPKGWFSGWWRTNAADEDITDSTNILLKFQRAMTPEEKEKLFKAIDYTENVAPLNYPIGYVDNIFKFHLKKFEFNIIDESLVKTDIIKSKLENVKCSIETRPNNNGLKVAAYIEKLDVFGMESDNNVPHIIKSQTDMNKGLLDVLFEINPLDSNSGQKLHINARPLRVIFDAQTVLQAINVFKVPSSSALDELSKATALKLNNIKDLSATGLQHIIEQHTCLDLNINLFAPYIVIPYGGKFTGAENSLILNLGKLSMISVPRDGTPMNVRQMYKEGIGKEDVLKNLIQQSYDKFNLELTNIQVLIAQGDENWLKYILEESSTSQMHLLTPLNVHLTFQTCLITDDPKLPLNKLDVQIPSLKINASDARLLLLLNIVNSTTLAMEKFDDPVDRGMVRSESMVSLSRFMEYQEQKLGKGIIVALKKARDVVEMTQLVASFELRELEIQVSHQEFLSSKVEKLLLFNVSSLKCLLTQQTFNMQVNINLQSMSMVQLYHGDNVEIIKTNTPLSGGSNYLLHINYIQVDKRCPELFTKYQSCLSSLNLDFVSLTVCLHQEALLNLLKFSNDILSQLEDQQPMRPKRSISMNSDSLVPKKGVILKKKSKAYKDLILFKLTASVNDVEIHFSNKNSIISIFSIHGVNSEIIMKQTDTRINLILKNIAIDDLNPENMHNKILMLEPTEQAINLNVVIVDDSTDYGTHPYDIRVQATLGCIKVTFVQWYINNMLQFLNKFQVARQAISQASEKAAKSAKENVHSFYEKATKIELDIKLKAPEIIIPESCTSPVALLVDLGYITISNKFVELKIHNELGHPVVIDELVLLLEQLKIERVVSEKGERVTLLEPLTFSLFVNRNLSLWYQAIPGVDINGNIDSVQLLLSKLDYVTVMNVLSQNLSEGKEEPHILLPVSSRSGDDLVVVKTESSILEHTDSKEIQVTTIVRWNFTMKSFKINLVTKNTIQNESDVNSKRFGLAELCLDGFAVRGRMLSNDSLSNSCLLVNCRLIDTRPGREDKINCLLSRLEDSVETNDSILSGTKNMIDITFQQKTGDMFIDVRIYSFTFILSIEYMLKLSSFFQTESVQRNGGTITQELSNTSIQAPPQKLNSMMTLTLKIEKPDLILVEHMDSVDTRALILHCEMLAKIRFVGNHQSINGNLKDIQMYTCIFDPTIRETTRNSVLDPVSVSIAGSTPDNRGLHIEVFISEMRLRVSLYTMELITSILNTLSSSNSQVVDDEEILKDNSDLWNIKPLVRDRYWFLKEEVAQDALTFHYANLKKTTTNLHELCILNMPVFLFTLEAGVGNKTFPMLLLESNFQGKISNWSSKMMVEATLGLQMGYYNSHLALWEPLIEPVTFKQEKRTILKPWELKLEVSMSDISEESPLSPSSPTESEHGEVINHQPAMNIDISSTTNLEITVTKSCLDVLNNLVKLFSSAISADTKKNTGEEAPYKVVNATGLDIVLEFDKSGFCLYGSDEAGEVKLEKDAEVAMDTKVKESRKLKSILIDEDKSLHEYYLAINIPELNCSVELPVIKADTRFFKLQTKASPWGLVSSIAIENGVTVVTLCSILMVHNTFNVPIDMYYMRSSGNELEYITTIPPGLSKHVPMKAVYSPTSELFFSVENYSVTTTPFIWKDLQLNLIVNKNLTCTSKKNKEEYFVIRTVGEMTQVFYEKTTKHTMASSTYNIYLRPAVILKNCLPITMSLTLQGIKNEFIINPGDRLEVPYAEPGKSHLVISLPDYLEKLWTCKHEVSVNPVPFSVWTFNSYDSVNKMSLDLGMHIINNNGSFTMSLYCPFWMLNKTGLNLSYRKSKKTEKNESSGSPLKNSDENLNILHHPPFFKGPILFSFNAKNFFGKKKACVKVEQGDWSDKFSIDVAGSSGVVACKYNNKIYQLGVNNHLSSNGLTKQITFTPYYVIINSTSFGMECQEFDRPADAWTKIPPKSCTALFPYSEQDNKLIKVRLENTNEITPPFLITESHTTLLKLKNKWGGINVDIQLTEGATYINLGLYDEGMAPAIVINDTHHTMNFWEKNSIQIKKLPPQCSMFYTWDNPSAQRVLVWEGGSKKEYENELRMDDLGKYSITNELNVYWVSFLDGMQRVLFFTCDSEMAANIQTSKQFEKVDLEITISIYGIGVSIVNNFKRQEIMYIGIASTGIIWETCKLSASRFKPMSTKDNMSMERAYQQYLLNESGTAVFNIEGNIEVNFESFTMSKPHKRMIRRHFQTGFWAQMKSGQHQMQIHAKINRLQIDNQLYDCTFPVLLAPVPPPKTIGVNDAHKPFAELSIVQLLIKNSQIRQFKYFKILIQEFHVKVDLGFVNNLMEIFDTAANTEEDQKEKFLTDLKRVDEALYMLVSTHSIQEQKSFYDLLHFSPLKMHVSFSMASGSNQISSIPNFLNVLLQGIGVTLTDLQDVVFKLAFFQKEYSFLTRRQLIQETSTHYIGQGVKQLYVLVLGLDVIGNPYGLVLGISKGVEDLFYEPFQGAIQGPGEFAEGLVLGVRSLFGHTVGGAAGAVSRITGAMGKGIAALTFDKDYQRKRRDQINQKPATVQAGLARGGKGLVMGVFDGVTGVFTKPISGAKEQGVGGFFKGLGKGAVGLVTRPTAGVMDFASTSFETVKRVTDFGNEDVNRLRAPRFMEADKYVKPYDEDLAYGNKLLCELEKGKYSTTDIYSCHYVIIAKKEVLILSNKRIAYITHNDIFGGWQVDWSYTWQDLEKGPAIVPKGIQIFSDGRKKGIFGSNDTSKVILINDEDTCRTIAKCIEKHMNST